MTRAGTDDALLGGQLMLRQPAAGARAGSDAVLLAAAVPAKGNQHVLELGCGTGAAMLCLARRVVGVSVTGIELEAKAVEFARLNIERNGLATRAAVILGDIAAPPRSVTGASFDHVMANPPFFAAGRASPAPDASRRMARLAAPDALEIWMRAAARMVKPRGSVTVICRTERLDDLIAACRRRFGGIVLFPLWPGGGKPAKRFILQARAGSGAALRLVPGLVLHGGGSTYTEAAQRVLRGGEALTLL
ncbi:MAG TPA: methyltransferase [Candidatus Cybelea sp.]|nr:methyltransferase [Candidatus Cybelea sp.]